MVKCVVMPFKRTIRLALFVQNQRKQQHNVTFVGGEYGLKKCAHNRDKLMENAFWNTDKYIFLEVSQKGFLKCEKKV